MYTHTSPQNQRLAEGDGEGVGGGSCQKWFAEKSLSAGGKKKSFRRHASLCPAVKRASYDAIFRYETARVKSHTQFAAAVTCVYKQRACVRERKKKGGRKAKNDVFNYLSRVPNALVSFRKNRFRVHPRIPIKY